MTFYVFLCTWILHRLIIHHEELFAEHEKITMQMCLSMHNVDKIKSMSSFQPDNVSVRNMDLLLKPIFVDVDPEPGNEEAPPIIYSVTSSGIMELHGAIFPHDLSLSLFNQLLLSAATDVSDKDCLVYMLCAKYVEFNRMHPRRRNVVFINFVQDQLSQHTADIVEGREDDDVFMNDVAELRALITEAFEENRYCLRYVCHFMYLYMSFYILFCTSFYVYICHSISIIVMLFYVFLCHLLRMPFVSFYVM